MAAHIRRTILAAAVAALAAASPAPAEDGGKDDLAGGDWEGIGDFDGLESGGSGGGAPTPSAPAPATAGTPTEPGTAGGTATEPSNPVPAPGGEEPAPSGDGATAPAPDGDGGGGSAAPPLAPLPSCGARWVCEVESPTPWLHEEETLLTLVLFRTDAFAFVCGAYCRSESTWYVDWFAATEARQDGITRFSVELRLEDACPACDPVIRHEGLSLLSAEARVRALWGGVDASTVASATARAAWLGPIDCGDSCSASARCSEATSEYGLEFGGAKAGNTETTSYTHAVALGGKADSLDLPRAETEVTIRNQAAVATYAGGTEDNAQAKARAGYDLRLLGISKCGAWGEYEVRLVEK